MKKIIFSIVILCATLFSQTAVAQLRFIEGEDYQVLPNPLPLQKAGQKEVMEFFSYACPHCYNLNESVIAWEKEHKPEGVAFYQVPASGGQWDFVAHVKFVADKLGLGHDFDQAFFEAIHRDGNRRLMVSKDQVIDFMVDRGLERSVVEKAWNSLQVKSKEKQAKQLWQAAGLSGVPAILVNGKYIVTLTEPERLFEVVNYLLEVKPL